MSMPNDTAPNEPPDPAPVAELFDRDPRYLVDARGAPIAPVDVCNVVRVRPARKVTGFLKRFYLAADGTPQQVLPRDVRRAHAELWADLLGGNVALGPTRGEVAHITTSGAVSAIFLPISSTVPLHFPWESTGELWAAVVQNDADDQPATPLNVAAELWEF